MLIEEKAETVVQAVGEIAMGTWEGCLVGADCSWQIEGDKRDFSYTPATCEFAGVHSKPRSPLQSISTALKMPYALLIHLPSFVSMECQKVRFDLLIPIRFPLALPWISRSFFFNTEYVII